jgi:hypothetical protein
MKSVESTINYQSLASSLKKMQDQVIGLFIPSHYHHTKIIELVINKDGSQLTSINIGTLLGLQTSHFSTERGRYIPFPDNKTLTEMMKNPTEFDKWWKEQKIS